MIVTALMNSFFLDLLLFLEALLRRKAAQAPMHTRNYSGSILSCEGGCCWMDFFAVSFVVDMGHHSDA